MAYKKFYPKYRKKAVAKKRVYKRKTASKPSIKMMIKKALDKRIENKQVCQTNERWYIPKDGPVLGSYIQNMTPQITQTIGENGRVGNTVNLKNAYLRGVMSLANNAGTPYFNSQFQVRLFIGKLKIDNLAPNTADLQTLLRQGAATSAFDSTQPLSIVRSVNRDYFTVYYDKIHKIGTQHNGSGNIATGIGNNDYTLSKMIKINCTKMFKKTLTFNDTNPQPINCGLYMWAGIVDSMCSTITSGSPAVQFTYDLEFSYEDA